MFDSLKTSTSNALTAFDRATLLALPLDAVKGITASQAGTAKTQAGYTKLGDFLGDPASAARITAMPWLRKIYGVFDDVCDHATGGEWAARFAAAPLDAYVNHPGNPFRIEFGPVFFRGRLDGSARVLVVGQDPSTDEILAQRTLVGDAGQRAQWLLSRIGLRSSYLMLNTFAFSVYATYGAMLKAVSQEPAIANYRNMLFDAAKAGNALEAVIAFGSAARDAVAAWPGRGSLKVFELLHPSAHSGVEASWSAALAGMAAAITPDAGLHADTSPITVIGDTDIPRFDLPFGIPDWHGTAGKTTSTRNGAAVIEWQKP